MRFEAHGFASMGALGLPGDIVVNTFMAISFVILAHTRPFVRSIKKATNIIARGFFYFGAEGEI